MLVLTSLHRRKVSYKMWEMWEGFGEMKSRMRAPEMNLIFKHFQKSALPLSTCPGFPFKLLTPTPGFSPSDSHLLFSGQLQVKVNIYYSLPSR